MLQATTTISSTPFVAEFAWQILWCCDEAVFSNLRHHMGFLIFTKASGEFQATWLFLTRFAFVRLSVNLGAFAKLNWPVPEVFLACRCYEGSRATTRKLSDFFHWNRERPVLTNTTALDQELIQLTILSRANQWPVIFCFSSTWADHFETVPLFRRRLSNPP